MQKQPHDLSDADEWRSEWLRRPLFARIIFSTFLIIGACGGFLGADSLIHEFSRSWVAWVVAMAVLEPVGLACALGLLVLMLPRTRFAHFFVHAIKRAKIASILVGLVFAGAILWVVYFLLYELWQMRS